MHYMGILGRLKARGGARQYILTASRRIFYYAYAARRLSGESTIEINGYRLHLDVVNDAGLTRELYIYRKWEENVTDFVLTAGILKKGAAVLDIGANIGYYTCIFSRLAGSRGTVYAVEPVSDNRMMLEKNLKINGMTNVKTYSYAMGECDGEDSIYVSRKKNWSAFYPEGLPDHVPAGDVMRREKVKVLSVDSFLKNKKPPDLIRMDLEGYEYNVIKGMSRTLEGKTALLVEMHTGLLGHEKLREIILLLKDKGFKEAITFQKRGSLPGVRTGITDVIGESGTCNIFFTKNSL